MSTGVRTGEPSPKSGAGEKEQHLDYQDLLQTWRLSPPSLKIDVKVRLEALADDAFERGEIDCLIIVGTQDELFCRLSKWVCRNIHPSLCVVDCLQLGGGVQCYT
jgi:hypothetical protein